MAHSMAQQVGAEPQQRANKRNYKPLGKKWKAGVEQPRLETCSHVAVLGARCPVCTLPSLLSSLAMAPSQRGSQSHAPRS